MTDTLFPTPKDLFGTLLEAQSEADVRQIVLAELPLGQLEYLQTDYPLSKAFKDAREKLRQSVEQTTLEVCF